MSKFRAIMLGKCISISEVDKSGIIVRCVAVIEQEAMPQFLDDMQTIINECKTAVIVKNTSQ